MKDTAFIICEYNPFHNGHRLHLDMTRAAGAKNVVCVMSGNCVQRGELSFCDKTTRAGFAIRNGADLILEIPVKYVLSGANYFARGAIETILQTGLSGTLSFGASVSAEELAEAVGFLSSKDIKDKISLYSERFGVTYARAVRKTAEREAPALAALFDDPNNILAMEYMKGIRELHAPLDCYAVKRSVAHDSCEADNHICSAKYIRDSFREQCGWAGLKQYFPDPVFETLQSEYDGGRLPVDLGKFSAAAMALLSRKEKEDLLKVNGVKQGLENRIVHYLKDASDVYALYDAVKTKRFTHARIRQVLLSAVLDIDMQELERPQPYVRVLGMNKTGRALIPEIRKSATVPVIMNLSEAPYGAARSLDERCGKLYDICRPQAVFKNSEYAQKPYVEG